ncbi:hypothetical protein ACRALDRAFT_2017576 [Sodiomyces alcalophilus JCM 7366]|uniref:uncharacterized protein n=1 Tax=Sodiomyces alcalophilus JCM 7366 TaxID=591952 RepID=UPI0039B3E6A1
MPSSTAMACCATQTKTLICMDCLVNTTISITNDRARRKYKWDPIHYADGLLSCLYRQYEPTPTTWPIVVRQATRDIVTTRWLRPDCQYFVRNNADYLVCGHRIQDRPDNSTPWVLLQFRVRDRIWGSMSLVLGPLVDGAIGQTIYSERDARDDDWAWHYFAAKVRLAEPVFVEHTTKESGLPDDGITERTDTRCLEHRSTVLETELTFPGDSRPAVLQHCHLPTTLTCPTGGDHLSSTESTNVLYVPISRPAIPSLIFPYGYVLSRERFRPSRHTLGMNQLSPQINRQPQKVTPTIQHICILKDQIPERHLGSVSITGSDERAQPTTVRRLRGSVHGLKFDATLSKGTPPQSLSAVLLPFMFPSYSFITLSDNRNDGHHPRIHTIMSHPYKGPPFAPKQLQTAQGG